MPSSRPRNFYENQICNACDILQTKKKLNGMKEKEFLELCGK